MSSAQLYDTIGSTYTATRRTEPRIATRVWAALGGARTVLNVGAGTGSYEPSDRDVTAVEPSTVMRAQRPADAARCVAATAESLPFEDKRFDAAMAFSTVHHWRVPIAGMREMQRVARRVVVFTCETSDRAWRSRFWLTRDYLPEVAPSRFGLATELASAIGARVEPVLVPWDCVDGFFEAYWRRPEAYLDEDVRRGISVWARVGPDAEQRAVRSLRDDLVSGWWAERNRDLLDLEAADLGLPTSGCMKPLTCARRADKECRGRDKERTGPWQWKASRSKFHAESKHRRQSSSRSWRIRNVTWTSTDPTCSGEPSSTPSLISDVGDTFTMKMHRLVGRLPHASTMWWSPRQTGASFGNRLPRRPFSG